MYQMSCMLKQKTESDRVMGSHSLEQMRHSTSLPNKSLQSIYANVLWVIS